MSIAIEIKIGTTQEVLAALTHLFLDEGSKHTLFDRIGIALTENNRERFKRQVSPDGVPWIPSQRALAQNGETLRDTGSLRDTLSHEVLPDGVAIGSDKVYAAPLFHGVTIRRHDGKNLVVKGAFGWFSKPEVIIPPREFLGFNAEDEATTLEIINRFLGESLK